MLLNNEAIKILKLYASKHGYRNIKIAFEVISGKYYWEVGKEFGLSKERIGQIAHRIIRGVSKSIPTTGYIMQERNNRELKLTIEHVLNHRERIAKWKQE